MQRRYREVDVFTDVGYQGNPLAVVVDAEGLDTGQMQRFAHWTNFSETTFLLPPTDPVADYAVRIFTPTQELPFAGHPTLGTAAVWAAVSGSTASSLTQQCGVGLVPVRRDGTRFAFAAPTLLRGGPVDDETLAQACAELRLGRDQVVDAQWVDNGPGWLGILLADADSVLAVRPGAVELDLGIIGPHADGDVAFEVRAFFPKDGTTAEDPVTGSLNASLAQWMLATGRAAAPYRVRQGTALGRAGDVHVSVDDDGVVWVGGGVVTCVEGTVTI